MKYLNPFLLLELSPESAASEQFAAKLKRTRKAVMAEFELQDAVEIELAGQRVDRETVLRLIEELESPEIREHHSYIATQPALYDFLTESSLELFYEGHMGLLSGQPKAFLKWIAPYFSVPFNTRLLHALKQKDEEEIQHMCALPLPIPSTHHASCYQDSYRYLHAQVEDIEALTQEIAGGKAPDGRVQEYCDEILIDAMNALPDYFNGVRDRYGLALESLAIEVHNTHQRAQLGMFILKQGLKLSVSDETRRRLQHILEQLQRIAPVDNLWENLTGTTSEEKKPTLIWVALGVGAAIFLAIKWLF